MVEFVKEICDRVGPRPPGSNQEALAAEMIRRKLQQHCDETMIEKFTTHPRALQALINVTCCGFVISTAAYYLISPLLSAILFSCLFIIFFLTRHKDAEIVEKIIKKAESQNVTGKIMASERAERILIFSGHHDSAFAMPLLGPGVMIAAPILHFLGILCVLILPFVALLSFIGIGGEIPARAFTVISITGTTAMVIYKFGMVTRKPVLGANDNLSAVSVLVAMAEHLSRNRPRHTEVWLVSFGAEEPANRGARAFVKEHFLKLENAYLVNMDMVGQKGNLVTIKKELDVGEKHSEELINIILKAAASRKIPMKPYTIIFGSTDATPFSRKKIEACSLMRFDERGLPQYVHNSKDGPESIIPEHLSETRDICLEVIDYFESETDNLV